jgi:hypothetical protein
MATDLGKRRIRVYQHTASAEFQLRNPVNVAKVEVNITLLTQLGQTLTWHTVRGPVFREVTPVVIKAVGAQQTLQVSNPVAGVRSHNVAGWVITRVGPPVVLEEGYLMAQAPEAQ